MNQIASDLYKALTESDERKPKAGDVKATVIREEGNTVWVKFPGGEDETPVEKTNNATMGDEVLVRVADGRAWILGNNTNPATDDTEAKKASHKAVEAFDAASFAAAAAETAQVAADSAVRSAEIANENAESAQSSANAAQSSAIEAQDYASQALHNAEAAQDSANQAIEQASFIENVVGVVDWIATHATYALSNDTSVVPNTLYFTLTGEAVTTPTGSPEDNGYYELNNGVYVLSTDTTVDQQKTYYTVTASVVNTPTGNPSTSGYYELVDVKEGVSNYVSTHLALTNDGLLLQNDTANGYRLLISPEEGIVLYSPSGRMASYGSSAVIGDANGFHIQITDQRLSFYRDATNEVAYVSGDKLYITQSVVLQQMDIGTTVANNGLGQWSWKVHANADNPARNNLYLKWIG